MIAELKKKIEKMPQRQDSVMDQMKDLYLVANHLGMYDAADVIKSHFGTGIDICLTEGCNTIAQTSYRLCPKHLKEAHDIGFDDSNK